MSDCCNYFQFTDPGDSFASWEGLRGPKGDPGPQGEPGQGLVIQGIVATVGDLPASANQGDVYLVGASDPYEGYLWTDGAWEDIGELAMGPQGPAGTITVGTVTGLPAGSTPTVVNTGTAEAAVLDFGIPAGADGAPGQDGQDGAPGPGVAAGGTAGQYLVKQSATDFDTAWETRANIVNPNLLDNWYFVGGGSQLGYGVFPVNQREQAVYNVANQYTIDRWRTMEVAPSFELQSNGLFFKATTQGTWVSVEQYVGCYKDLLGKTVTISGLTTNNECLSKTVTVPSTIPASETSIAQLNTFTDAAWIYFRFKNNKIVFRISTNKANITSGFVAVKLELGDTQTLAHKEGNTWVLNEIPNFGAEMLKCQNYYVQIRLTTVSAYITTSGTVFEYSILLPCVMAKQPTVSIESWVGRNANGYIPESPSASSPHYPNPNSLSIGFYYSYNPVVYIQETVPTSQLTNNTMVILTLTNVKISAEP